MSGNKQHPSFLDQDQMDQVFDIKVRALGQSDQVANRLSQRWLAMSIQTNECREQGPSFSSIIWKGNLDSYI